MCPPQQTMHPSAYGTSPKTGEDLQVYNKKIEPQLLEVLSTLIVEWRFLVAALCRDDNQCPNLHKRETIAGTEPVFLYSVVLLDNANLIPLSRFATAPLRQGRNLISFWPLIALSNP